MSSAFSLSAVRIISCSIIIALGLMVVAPVVHAQDPEFQGVEFDPNGNIAKATKLPDENPKSITISAIQWALGTLGLVSVIMILFGGFTWMTAAGNEERVAKAKNIIRSAVIGLLIIMLSFAIVSFVIARSVEFTGEDEGAMTAPFVPTELS